MHRPNARTVALATLTALLLAPAVAFAGAEKVELPADWKTRFVVYNEIERPDRTPNQVRFMYVNPEAAAAARVGSPVPDRTVLVMEDRIAQLGPDGKPVRDAKGRLVPTAQVAAVAVMEKRAGWGSEYPPAVRNAEWEYAAYTPAGVKRTDVNTQPCFVCHTSRRDAAREYTFTFMKWVADGKPGPR
jgi:hypothetical protein